MKQLWLTLLPPLLLVLVSLPTTHQLPLTDGQLPQAGCKDPLHHLMPESRCPFGRRPVYMMFDVCPAKSVCVSDAELTACPQPVEIDDSQACPAEAPIRLFEYSPLEFACPRQRCVRLDCFTEFCHARRSSSRDRRPLLMAAGAADTCEYLRCGCPATEADLLVEGCRSPDELLVLTADAQSGCPVKLCIGQLPDSLHPLFPITSAPTPTVSFSQPQTECPSHVECPPNTSELTVPNSADSSACPLRICLLPELMNSASNNTHIDVTHLMNASTAAAAATSSQTAASAMTPTPWYATTMQPGTTASAGPSQTATPTSEATGTTLFGEKLSTPRTSAVTNSTEAPSSASPITVTGSVSTDLKVTTSPTVSAGSNHTTGA